MHAQSLAVEQLHMQIKKMSKINHKPSTNASKDTLGQPHNVHPADPAVPHAKSNNICQQSLQSKPLRR